MKRIAYIELDTHAEIAGNFRELMEDSAEFAVEYFFAEKIMRQLNYREDKIVQISSPKMIFSQLKKGHFDLVIIGTVHRYFNVFHQITKHFNTAVIVHNLNFTKLTKGKLLHKIFVDQTLYRLKLLLKEGLLKMPEVFQKASHRFVLENSLAVDSHFQYLPVFYNKFSNEKKMSDSLLIVIPGTVSQSRRDYKKIVGLLEKEEQLNSEHPEKTFVFLGKAAGEELQILKELKRKVKRNILVFFNEKVPKSEFDFWMKKADVLWCPVQLETSFFSNREQYGMTKMSGNIGDAINFGKFVIFPEGFMSEVPFVVSETENVMEKFEEISCLQYDFQQYYSRKKVSESLHQVLRKCLSD